MTKSGRDPTLRKKNICYCMIQTRDLWVSNPVDYPLGQYDLVLKKVFFLSRILRKYRG